MILSGTGIRNCKGSLSFETIHIYFTLVSSRAQRQQGKPNCNAVSLPVLLRSERRLMGFLSCSTARCMVTEASRRASVSGDVKSLENFSMHKHKHYRNVIAMQDSPAPTPSWFQPQPSMNFQQIWVRIVQLHAKTKLKLCFCPPVASPILRVKPAAEKKIFNVCIRVWKSKIVSNFKQQLYVLHWHLTHMCSLQHHFMSVFSNEHS